MSSNVESETKFINESSSAAVEALQPTLTNSTDLHNQGVYVIPFNSPANNLTTKFVSCSHLAQCYACGIQQATRVEHQSGTTTHIIALVLCLTTCCCCCLPYFFNNCKNTRHFCSNCGAYLGSKFN